MLPAPAFSYGKPPPRSRVVQALLACSQLRDRACPHIRIRFTKGGETSACLLPRKTSALPVLARVVQALQALLACPQLRGRAAHSDPFTMGVDLFTPFFSHRRSLPRRSRVWAAPGLHRMEPAGAPARDLHLSPTQDDTLFSLLDASYGGGNLLELPARVSSPPGTPLPALGD